MAFYEPKNLEALNGKVVVLTGGALGIGADLVRVCHKFGAHVFFGDVMIEQGEALAKELASSGPAGQHVQFIPADAADYKSNLLLFDTAFEACGKVDHAVAVAGLGERGNIVDPNLTLESVREEPPAILLTVGVNLIGPIYFSRIASVYLRQPELNNKSSTSANDKSLILVSSVAGFTETPGMSVYSSTKHGVYGLMRSLRKVLIRSSPHAIRTNVICPWMTETRIVSGIDDEWRQAGLPRNTPVEVAIVIASSMADTSLNGEALYVEGGRAWAIEGGVDRTQPQWMGEKQSLDFNRGQAVLASGASWIKKQ